MPHLPKLLAAAALVFGFAFAVGQAEAAPLPLQSALATQAGASHALPVEKSIAAIGGGVPATIIGTGAARITGPIITITGPILITGTGTGTGLATAIATGGKL
jgi:hypothetical protein